MLITAHLVWESNSLTGHSMDNVGKMLWVMGAVSGIGGR